MNKFDIIEKIKKNKDILESFGVKKLGIFGSYASDTATENSDIDIIIELSIESGMYKNYCRTKYFLEDLFNKDIDLLTLNQFEETYKTKEGIDNHEKIRKDILESVIYV